MNRAILILAGAACALGTGCEGNPFAGIDSDYAKQTPAARLRTIQPATLDQYSRPKGPDPTPEEIAASRRRFDGLERADLTLEECRASALEHNLDLKVALVNPTIAAQSVTAEDARFESAFTLRTAYQDLDSPTASTLVSAQSRTLTIDPGVSIPLRTGGTVRVDLPFSRSENNNSFSTLNPAYSSDLQVSLTHQLLRGAGRRSNTAALRIAGYNQQASQAQTKLEVIRQLAAVDRSYWRLFQARRELEVRQQQYELAKNQQERAQHRVDAGLSAPIEVLRSQAALADSLEAIIVAQNAVLFQQRELKRIINTPGLTIDTKVMVVTATPPDPVQYVFEPGALSDQAVANRMEMLDLELRLAGDAANIGFARNQMLPLLTLDYTYRVNGLGGSTQDSFRSLERNHFEDWELGLTATVPLGNEAARSQLRLAILQRIQRLSSKNARELSIRQEVLNAIDAIDAGWQRVLAARQAVILNNRALQAEQRQFEVGGATTNDVLDASSRLAQAQSAEAKSLSDYQVAQVDLAFATGTLLGASRVSWEPVPNPPLNRADPKEELPTSAIPPAPTVEPAPSGG